MSDKDFDIVALTGVPPGGFLSALDRSLGPGHTLDWFTWKHLENPFGMSLGWVAAGAEGVLGVRLFLRWELTNGQQRIRAVRPVDTATVPEARRRGVFRALTEHALALISEDPGIDLIFNTPNARSRPGYAAMGWSVLPRLAHGIRPVLPGRTAPVEPDASCNAFDVGANHTSCEGRLQTRRNAAYVRWRYESSSGVHYRQARLRGSETPAAIVYRVLPKRWTRLLLVEELVGAAAERTILLRSVARLEGAAFVMAATGRGALGTVGGFMLRRGGSVVAVRQLRPCTPEPAQLASWALTLGDLERVI